ncbi:hypothetical protein [Rhizobium sp. 2MFCol3.1]|uniref:hypothetical protein n=1 Tax=Rhizobium sp. 2MFCol3.1 TaxID=1246459 RepID=UPI00036D3539|nr:hypothetical protein [Rhizobium sp. 2MFCol3.1]
MSELPYKFDEAEHLLWVDWRTAHDKRYARVGTYYDWVMALRDHYDDDDPKYSRCNDLLDRFEDEFRLLHQRLAQMEQFYQDGDHFLVAKLRLSV